MLESGRRFTEPWVKREKDEPISLGGRGGMTGLWAWWGGTGPGMWDTAPVCSWSAQGSPQTLAVCGLVCGR